MPETRQKSLRETIREARACLEDLRALGLHDVPGIDPASLPPCPPGLVGIDRGGEGVCRQESLEEIFADLGDCRRCSLCKARTRIVRGRGNPHAQMVFVGEAPSREADACGEPLAGGEAGALFDRMLLAMGLTRDEVYCCESVMCRLPHNRPAQTDETAACVPFLSRQIGAIRPQLLVALGELAVRQLTAETAPFERLRGRWLVSRQGTAVMVTHHPATLLRQPSHKRETWEDLKQVMRKLREG